MMPKLLKSSNKIILLLPVGWLLVVTPSKHYFSILDVLMHEITLIGTMHKENGLCNATELYKILSDIQPNMIFEEHSLEMFKKVYDGFVPDSLETITNKLYREKNPIIQVPVEYDGNNLVDKQFKNEMHELIDFFISFPEHYKLSEL